MRTDSTRWSTRRSPGLSLINGTVIDAGPCTFLGGTTVDSAGKLKNRSDVWVIANGAVYSSTGGARNTTTWPKGQRRPSEDLPPVSKSSRSSTPASST